MGYIIDVSYEEEFSNLLNDLKAQYGEGLFEIDGIGRQLDINHFSKSFFKTEVAADCSVDPNSNVDDTSAITYTVENCKPVLRLDSYYMLWKTARETDGLEIANKIITAQLLGDIYINDVHGISGGLPYCFNYSALDVMYQGLPMVKKIVSLPPQHLLAFMSQIEQFITFAANSTLGATGLADLLIAASWYVGKMLMTKSDSHFHLVSEEDCFEYFRQQMISMIYTINQPARGNQSPFTNISIYDDYFLKSITDGIVFPDGSTPDINLIKKLQSIYIDCMNEELRRTPITFFVTTVCFTVKDNVPLDTAFVKDVSRLDMEHGFVNFYMGETSTLSSCCRLRSSTNNEFFNSFGAGSSKIGSLGVVTVNFPRLAYLSKTKEEFEERLIDMVDLTARINEAKRKIVRKRIDTNHLPLYTLGFMDLSKQYSTFGVNGFYECLQFLGENILTEEGQDYAVHLLKIINREIDKAQQKYKAPHNCEQVPGENSSIKLCKKDKYLGYQMHLDFYSNQFVPLTVPTDLFNRINIQGKLDKYFSGGSVLHINVEERIIDPEVLEKLIYYCASKGVVYFAINYLFNKCIRGHMSVGHREKCPICGGEIIGQYQRVVGFLTQVDFWNKVRREEDAPNRVFYHTNDLEVEW